MAVPALIPPLSRCNPDDGLSPGNRCVRQYRVVDRGEKALRRLKNTVEDWILAGEDLEGVD
jgi:hypothetical protein